MPSIGLHEKISPTIQSADWHGWGAQVCTKRSFGYGLLRMTVQPSGEPGIVNGFFMLKYYNSKAIDHEGKWDKGWTEIDFEVVPGNSDPNRRTVEGGDCHGAPFASCKQGKLKGTAANYVSMNIIGGPEDSGAVGDSQVFYPAAKDFCARPRTYAIDWQPDLVQWGVSENEFDVCHVVLRQDGLKRNSPYGSDCKSYCDDVRYSQGFQFLKGRDMHIWLNIYSGLGDQWGGSPPPKNNSQMLVTHVSFVPIGGDFHSKGSMISNFVAGEYSLDGNKVNSWTDIWANKPSPDWPIFTKAENVRVVAGTGLVLDYKL
jgi:hypothetical protein